MRFPVAFHVRLILVFAFSFATLATNDRRQLQARERTDRAAADCVDHHDVP